MSGQKAIDLEIAYLAPDPSDVGKTVKKEIKVTGTWAAAIKTAKSLDSEGYVILGIIYRPPVKPAAAEPVGTPTVCSMPDTRDWPMGMS